MPVYILMNAKCWGGGSKTALRRPLCILFVWGYTVSAEATENQILWLLMLM
jgi:hypothetical protein